MHSTYANTLRASFAGREQVAQADAVQHFRAEPVEHGEADIGAVLARIDMDPERPHAERRVDEVDDGVGDAADVGILRNDRGEGLLNLVAEAR